MSTRRELERIRCELETLAHNEERRLFRLARKAIEHGCTQTLVDEIKREAWDMYHFRMGSCTERMLNPFILYEYKHALRD